MSDNLEKWYKGEATEKQEEQVKAPSEVEQELDEQENIDELQQKNIARIQSLMFSIEFLKKRLFDLLSLEHDQTRDEVKANMEKNQITEQLREISQNISDLIGEM